MTNTTMELPGPRCGQYVSGGFASYPCWLELGHHGPCAALEVPASGQRRKVWEQENEQVQRMIQPHLPSAPATGPVEGVPTPPAALTASMLSDPVERQQKLLARLAEGDFESLPEWARQGMIASSAQVSLATFYHLAKDAFANGATVITLDAQFLDRLLTPAVRDFFDLFTAQQHKE